MAELFALSVTFLLVVISYKDPMAIPGLYLLLSNFFVVDIPFLGINTSWIYSLSLTFLWGNLLWNHWKKGLTLAPQLKVYGLGLPIIFLIVSGAHYLLWQQIPTLYLSSSLKSLWALGLLFLPREKISIERLFSYLFLSFVVSLILVAPESIVNYLKHGTGIGRELTPSPPDYKVLYGLGRPHPFVMDDNTYQNMGVASFTITLALICAVLNKRRGQILLFSLAMAITWVIFAVNTYFNSMISLALGLYLIFFTVILQWKRILHLPFARKYRNFTVVLIALFSFAGIGKIWYDITYEVSYWKHFRFSTKEHHYSKPSRIELYHHSAQAIGEDPWRGRGYPTSYFYQSTPSHKWVSGHSTLLDYILAFGLPLGTIATLPIFLPILLLLGKRLRRNISYFEYYCFWGFFLISFYQLFGAIFFRTTITKSVYFMMTIILLKKWERPLPRSSHFPRQWWPNLPFLPQTLPLLSSFRPSQKDHGKSDPTSL